MKKYSLEWFRKYHQPLHPFGGGPRIEFKDSVRLGCGGYAPYEMYWRNKIADEILAQHMSDICSDPECCNPGDSSCSFEKCTHIEDADIARGDQ